MSLKTETPKKAAVPGPAQAEIAALLDELSISPASNLIGALQRVQGRFGYLPAAALREMGRRMRIPLSRIYGVVSFYAQFYTAPRGRHIIRVCRGTACHVRGSLPILETLWTRLGLGEGCDTTPDRRFTVETVSCLGACGLAPAAVVNDEVYGQVTPQSVVALVDRIQASEEAP